MPYDVTERWNSVWRTEPLCDFMQLELLEYSQGEGAVTVAMPFRTELGNIQGHLGIHGGALAALIDAVANFAVAITIGSDKTLTSNIRVDYVARAAPGTVYCECRVTNVGKRTAIVDATLRNGDGHTLALGRVGLSHRPEE